LASPPPQERVLDESQADCEYSEWTAGTGAQCDAGCEGLGREAEAVALFKALRYALGCGRVCYGCGMSLVWQIMKHETAYRVDGRYMALWTLLLSSQTSIAQSCERGA
jgi:hypothetical protein